MQMDLFGNDSNSRDGGGGDGGQVETVALHEAARERYLNYAISVITSRALPDVRDGLKPVQRRILYAMYHDLHLHPDGRFRKSAAVVGEVMGKYHPHGDQSIYDAMVRMAQSFSMRYPLVNGHGNFGSIDGDPPAAMRYTEAKLRSLAEELLTELKQRTVDYRPNYDGQLFEPIVLPAQVPNLLINGAVGIAVGLATNIPPHHLGEVVDGLLALIDYPGISLEELVEYVPAPDFPTGGEILNTHEELGEIYRTGQGPVKLRGQYETEIVNRKRSIIITSVPYGLNKSALVEKIAGLIVSRRVPQIVDIRDESTDDVRIVMELKRGADPAVAMAFLYRHTALQQNFHVNLTCLVPTGNVEIAAPERVDLKSMLRYFLDFRLQIVTRRLQYQHDKLRERIHVLEAFEIIFDALDEAIAIIRRSEGKADAAQKLMARFGLDELQVDAILELKLYRLARLEILVIEEELRDKRIEADRIAALLADTGARWQLIHNELAEIRDAYNDKRRTHVVGPDGVLHNFDPEAYIVRENAWVIVTRQGRVKRQKGFSEVSAIRVPDGDEVGWVVRTDTRQTVTFYTQLGSAYVSRVDGLPQTTGYGDPLQTFFTFSDGEFVVGVTCSDPDLLPAVGEEEADRLSDDDPRPPFALSISEQGKALRFPLVAHAEVSTRNGRRYMGLAKDDHVVHVVQSAGDEHVTIASRGGRVIIFPVAEVPPRANAARGVNALKLVGDDRILGFQLTTKKREGLKAFTNRGREIIVRETSFRIGRRGGRGIEVIRLGGLERCEWPVQILQPTSESAAGDRRNGHPTDEGNDHVGTDGCEEGPEP